MINKIASTSVEINETIAKRWSPRAFDNDREVSNEQIIGMCEAARWAASAMNEQPYRFIIFNKFEDENAYTEALSCINKWNLKWAPNAPVIVAVISHKKNEDGKDNPYAEYDTGLAVQNFVLQATDFGLMAHQMGGILKDEIIKKFNIPENFVPVTMIAVGYQAESDILEEPYLSRESAPRQRKPLSFNFFKNKWNSPIE